ncbi:MAG: terpene cyclase/mutase family protein [Planctomycetota bacterium]|nr:terpene cyclase/mutase family protein [Planctomycetota bacterium]
MRAAICCICLLVHCQAEQAKTYNIYEAPSEAERHQMVEEALQFLAKGQNGNGSFGLYKEVGVTSAVLHALLLSDPKYRNPENEVTLKALAFLLNNVQPDGRIADGKGYDNYKTSLAVSALTALPENSYRSLLDNIVDRKLLDEGKEKGALTREKVMSSVRDWFGKQQAQESNGYDKDKDPNYGGQGYGGVPMHDLSNSQFAMDAMHSLGVRQGDPFFSRMEIFVNRTQNLRAVNDLTDTAKFPELKNFAVQDDGGFAYAPGVSKSTEVRTPDGKKFAKSYASITAAGLKTLIQLGVKKEDIRVQRAKAWLSSNYSLEKNTGLDTPGESSKGSQGLYYFYWTFAKAMSALGDQTLKLKEGTEINWAEQLAGKLKSLQREDGSWLNEQDRWQEGDPNLVTSYCLVALYHCKESLQK